MSFSNYNIGKKVDNLETSEIFNTYGRIDVIMGEDEQGNVITVSYPNIADSNVSGRIMTVEMPMCTNTTLARTAAQRIYTSLMTKDPTAFQYTPFDATGALADPSLEFGDSVDINGVHGGFYSRATAFGHLMKCSLAAPTDEEIDHEFPYQDAQQRQITRSNKEFKSGIYVNAQNIRTEVSERIAGDNQLSSDITQTAESIRADVVAKEGGNVQSFGWKLLATEFGLYSNNTKVFWVNENGANIKGTLQVGTNVGSSNGFVISSTAIYKNISQYGGTQTTGVYIGTDGIQLGQNFKVSNTGAVEAKSLSLTGGSIKLGGTAANPTFQVTTAGKVYAKDLEITGGKINLGSGVFQVTNNGEVTASKLTINGGSIKINNGVFNVETNGAVTASNLTVSGGSIKIGGTSDSPNFQVASNGNVTIKYGSIKIGGSASSPNFEVTTTGSVTIKNGSIKIGGTSSNPNFEVTTTGAVTIKNGSIKIGGTSSAPNFEVNSSGALTARAITLYGNLTLYNAAGTKHKTISADTLAEGALDGYDWANTSYGDYSSYADYALSGAGDGFSAQGTWNVAQDRDVGIDYFKTSTLDITNVCMLFGSSLSKQYMVINNVTYPVVMWGNPY